MAEQKRKSRVTTRMKPANLGEALGLTLEEAFNYFIHAKATEGVRERTLQDYRDHHRWFVDWLDDNYPEVKHVTEITTQMLREYVYFLTYEKQLYRGHPTKEAAEKEKRGLKPASVNIRISTMKAFYRWLHAEGYISVNPAANIRKQPVEEDTIGAFTEEQIDLLLRTPDQNTYPGFRDYVMMRLFLESGMRVQELIALRTSDIDVGTRIITLGASINKNRKARVIPLGKEMIRLLLELIAENKVHFPEEDHVFLSSYGNPLTREGIVERIKLYGKKVGIADKVRCSPHTFRHTFALNFLKAGADIIALQRILGHSTMDMVRKYVQHTTEDLLEAHDKFIEARLRGRRSRNRVW